MDLTEAQGASSNRHFWELSRADSVLRSARNLLDQRCLDFGAGDLYFSHRLHKQSGNQVFAYDPLATYRVEDPTLIATNQLSRLREHAPFDRIFLLDVLEHVAEEKELLAEVLSLLSADGELIVTVPAFQFLFSGHDVFLKHFRRYSRSQLLNALEANGFHIEQSSYFYASLFAARLIQQGLALVFDRKKKQQVGVDGWPFPEHHPITRLLRGILDLDFRICRALSRVGITLPGLSVFAICKKKSA